MFLSFTAHICSLLIPSILYRNWQVGVLWQEYSQPKILSSVAVGGTDTEMLLITCINKLTHPKPKTTIPPMINLLMMAQYRILPLILHPWGYHSGLSATLNWRLINPSCCNINRNGEIWTGIPLASGPSGDPPCPVGPKAPNLLLQNNIKP